MRPKIAFALGGGGARGCAHIGVLKILERERVPIDLITGTSIGALVGSMYATNPDAGWVEHRFEEWLASREFRKSGLDLFKRREPAENFFGQVATTIKERLVVNIAQSKVSMVGRHRLQTALQFLIPETRIENTAIPFCAVASNLLNCEWVLLQSGEIRDAVCASASIPGFLPPVEHNGTLLVDGSVVCPIPVEPALECGADIVIAVDVSRAVIAQPNLDNVINVVFQSNHMTARLLAKSNIQKADVAIRPNVGHVHWSEFRLLPQLIDEGTKATEEVICRIHKAIREKRGLWGRLRMAI